MGKRKYAIGVDFGSESGRAVLVNVATGAKIAAAVHAYANGVIDKQLPGTIVWLEHDCVVQDPNDYLEVFKRAIPAIVQESPVRSSSKISSEWFSPKHGRFWRLPRYMPPSTT